MARLRTQRRQSLVVCLAAAAFLAVAIAAAGCGSKSSDTSSSTAKADVLKVVQQGGFVTLDPRSSSSQEVFLLANMYEPLRTRTRRAVRRTQARPGNLVDGLA